MSILFISDLHLSPSTPEINQCFIRFMRDEAAKADALYVLGDLFDFWVGDDDKSDFATLIREEFKALTSLGIPCFFVKGNRDFLVGKRFARETGVTLLGDETVIDLYGQKAVVLHGDTLCTQDTKYLAYREKVNQAWLQWVFNRIPMFIKRKIVRKVQGDIRQDKKMKSLEIMDVTPEEVFSVMDKHQVALMIHGHTHRPDIHRTNHKNANYTRIVLGDWYTQGSVLVYDKTGYELQHRPLLNQ